MNSQQTAPLALEWGHLQRSFTAYERDTLAIKLGAVAVYMVAMILSLDVTVTAALLAVLWVQEAVWRTFQARVAQRIARVETLLASGAEAPACQLHSEFAATRRGLIGTLVEYAAQLPRPAVAFPHAVLLVLNFTLTFDATGGGSPV